MNTRETPTVKNHSRFQAKQKTILIIDDNPEVLSLNKLILELEGHHVVTAPGGREALKILSEIAAPSLILLDVRMDDMSGPELLKVLEQQMPDLVENVPIVFMSALDEGPPSRATGLIHKPIDVDKFVAAVEGLLSVEQTKLSKVINIS